jgi:succinate-semialdehyde dehydrogenase/glutarate-semialdehyde dehydrogenase
MDKPIVEAEAEIEKCVWNCEYYAENAEKFLASESIATNAAESYVSFQPLGVILALMPWNFPYWQVLRFAVPALMAGNTAVLKHASNVSRAALDIERLFQESGFPQGVFRTVLVPGVQTGKLIVDRRIAAVTLTGSDAAGVAVATASGQVLKKNVLEPGGSDAFIVLEDADLDAAAQMAARARYQNTGQSCIAAKRFIVVERVARDFERKFVDATAQLRVGSPLERETQIGPVARGDLREALERQVQASVKMGARVLLGGNLWTADVERGRRIARHLESGAVFINGMTASDPRLPFGGVKRSGSGRELSSFGMREFVNIQTVWIGPAAGAPVTRVASK